MENSASAVAADAAAIRVPVAGRFAVLPYAATIFLSSFLREAAAAIEDRAGLPTFTDAHHNLLRILK